MIKGKFKNPKPDPVIDAPVTVPYRVLFGPVNSKCVLTKTMIEQLSISLLETGVLETAANKIGIKTKDICRWAAKGEEEILNRESGVEPNLARQLYVDLVHTLERSKSLLEHKLAQKWVESATNPQVKRTYKTLIFEDGRQERYLDSETISEWSDWRGIAELLARRFPERWKPKQAVEMTGEGGGPVKVDHRVVSIDMVLDKIPIEVRKQLLAVIEGMQEGAEETEPRQQELRIDQGQNDQED